MVEMSGLDVDKEGCVKLGDDVLAVAAASVDSGGGEAVLGPFVVVVEDAGVEGVATDGVCGGGGTGPAAGALDIPAAAAAAYLIVGCGARRFALTAEDMGCCAKFGVGIGPTRAAP